MANKFGFLILCAFFYGVLTCSVWMNGFGTVTPYGDVIEPVGATVKIDCTLSQNISFVTPGDSQQLMWKKNRQLIPKKYVRVVDDYTAQLLLPNATINDSGRYMCLYNTSSDLKMVCDNDVQIGYPPLNVTDFSCVSPNWQYLLCTFTAPYNPVKTTYGLVYVRSAKENWNCTLSRQRSRYTFNMTSDSLPLYAQARRKYIFLLKANNKLGSLSLWYTIDHYSRVIPSAPVNLTVTTINSTLIKVFWSYPVELKYLPVAFISHLRYHSEWDAPQIWNSAVYVSNSSSTFSSTLNVTPYTEYFIEVKCRSTMAKNKDGLWSQTTAISHRTISDIPGQPPSIVPGSFQDKRSLDSRAIYIFWQVIPLYERKGPEFSYVVRGSTYESGEEYLLPEVIKENYAVFHGLQQEVDYTFQIYSQNKVGRSVNTSYLTLPKQSKLIPKPEAFTAIYFDHGVYELSWKAAPLLETGDVTNYILFWCNNIKPYPFYCLGNVSLIYVPQETRAYNITLFDTTVNYHFAISVNTKFSTSGIVWATCLIPYNGTLNKMKSITLTAINESSIKITWKLDCSERIGIVTGFNIYYCPVSANDTRSSCIEPELKSFANGSSKETYTIEKLTSFTYYKVVVAAVTRAGEGEHSNGNIARTHETAPSTAAFNITSTNKTDASITLEWDAPDPPSGNIVKYVIYGGPKLEHLKVLPHQTHFQFTLQNLSGFSDYNIELSACISDTTCSKRTEAFHVKTEIGVPDVMGRIQIVKINSTHIMLSFNDPIMPNGPIDYHNLLVTWEVDGTNHSEHLSNITEKEVVYETRCGDPDVESSTLYFSSQAVNVWQGNIFVGPFSEPVLYECVTFNSGYVALIATLSTVAIVLGIGLLIYFTVRFKRKYIEMKNIPISVPKGFETENLKSNFHISRPLQQTKSKNVKDLDEAKLRNDISRSRNTSGETRISTSSIDELLQRSGERNGDNSSALGSVSSTQTARSNLSSDLSNSDANSLPPTTPEMIFLDNPIQPMKSVPEVECIEVDSPKHIAAPDDPPASYSRVAQYLGETVPSNGYIQTLPASPEHSAYVSSNPPDNSYSQVGLAAGYINRHYPGGGTNENAATIQAEPPNQYSQLGLSFLSPSYDDNLLGYSAVGLAKDSLPSDLAQPGYVSAALAEDPCENNSTELGDKCGNVKPLDNSLKVNPPGNDYIPMASNPENSSHLYSRVSFHQPSGSGYVPPSEMNSTVEQPSVKSISESVSSGLGNVPLVCDDKEMNTPPPSDTKKPSTPKKNGYISLDMMEDKSGCLNSSCSVPNEIMKTSHLSDESSGSPGPYSRVVSMTFDDANMAKDQNLK